MSGRPLPCSSLLCDHLVWAPSSSVQVSSCTSGFSPHQHGSYRPAPACPVPFSLLLTVPVVATPSSKGLKLGFGGGGRRPSFRHLFHYCLLSLSLETIAFIAPAFLFSFSYFSLLKSSFTAFSIYLPDNFLYYIFPVQ